MDRTIDDCPRCGGRVTRVTRPVTSGGSGKDTPAFNPPAGIAYPCEHGVLVVVWPDRLQLVGLDGRSTSSAPAVGGAGDTASDG